jgi:transcriptional regulator with XRE-family HTH domain
MAGEDARKQALERLAFGSFLRGCRAEKKMTLRKFAEEVRVTPAYISRIETGRDGPPSSEILERMEDVLDLRRGTLFAKAKEAPREFIEAFTKNQISEEMLPRFMREVQKTDLSEEDWEEIIRSIRDKGKKK